jgi:hypothetical protein
VSIKFLGWVCKRTPFSGIAQHIPKPRYYICLGTLWTKVHAKFHRDCYVFRAVMAQLYERLQCWYLGWAGFMMFVVQMASCGMIYPRWFTNYGTRVLRRCNVDITYLFTNKAVEMGSDVLIYIDDWFSQSQFIAENYGQILTGTQRAKRYHKVLLVIQTKGSRLKTSPVPAPVPVPRMRRTRPSFGWLN